MSKTISKHYEIRSHFGEGEAIRDPWAERSLTFPSKERAEAAMSITIGTGLVVTEVTTTRLTEPKTVEGFVAAGWPYGQGFTLDSSGSWIHPTENKCRESVKDGKTYRVWKAVFTEVL